MAPAGCAGLLGRHWKHQWFLQGMGFSQAMVLRVREAGGCAGQAWWDVPAMLLTPSSATLGPGCSQRSWRCAVGRRLPAVGRKKDVFEGVSLCNGAVNVTRAIMLVDVMLLGRVVRVFWHQFQEIQPCANIPWHFLLHQ